MSNTLLINIETITLLEETDYVRLEGTSYMADGPGYQPFQTDLNINALSGEDAAFVGNSQIDAQTYVFQAVAAVCMSNMSLSPSVDMRILFTGMTVSGPYLQGRFELAKK